MTKLSRNGKYLRNLLFVYIIVDILLTPTGGIENRPSSNVTTLGFATVLLLFIGLALIIVSLGLIFRNPTRSPILAIIGAGLYFPAAVADQAGLFSSLPPPLGIFYLEIIQGVVAVAMIVLAVRMRKEKLTAASTSSGPKSPDP